MGRVFLSVAGPCKEGVPPYYRTLWRLHRVFLVFFETPRSTRSRERPGGRSTAEPAETAEWKTESRKTEGGPRAGTEGRSPERMEPAAGSWLSVSYLGVLGGLGGGASSGEFSSRVVAMAEKSRFFPESRGGGGAGEDSTSEVSQSLLGRPRRGRRLWPEASVSRRLPTPARPGTHDDGRPDGPG